MDKSTQVGNKKSTNRGAVFFAATFIALALAGIVSWAHSGGWLWWLILVEAIGGTILYFSIRASLNTIRWSSME